jgi:hypothetical protein
MAQEEVTLGELYRVTLAQTKTLDEIRADVRAQNGRVGHLEGVAREHGVKLTNLNREVFHRRADDRESATTVEAKGDKRGISERDVRMFLAGAGALGAVVVAIWKILPFLTAVKP